MARIHYDAFPAVYQQINQRICAMIVEQQLPDGHVLPTLRELAQNFEVSLRTAQLAVNELCESRWAKRVGKKLIVARSAQTASIHRAYIVYYNAGSSDLDVISAKILTGIQEEAAKSPNNFVVLATSLEQAIEKCRAMSDVSIGGVILLRNQSSDSLAAMAHAFPALRIVQVNYFLDGLMTMPENVRGVFNDDFAGAFQGTEYLLGQGCRRPVFLELDIPDQVYRIRREGYLCAMRDHQLEGRLLTRPNADTSEQLLHVYEEFAAEVYRNMDGCDAVFACNDFLAHTAAAYLKSHGVAIPVLGYDDYAEFFVPRHTTIAVPFKEMGNYAVRQLQQELLLPRFHRLLPQLKIRHTSPSPLPVK